MTTTDTRRARKDFSSIRIPADLLERVDRYAGQLEAELHVSVSRSDAIRRLIILGLEDAEDIHDAEAALCEGEGIPLAEIKAEYGL